MAIKKLFNGQTIRKPGAYSRDRVDNSAGPDLGATDIIFIVGESSQGAPGEVEGIQSFSSDRLSSLIAKYGSGPLVDCAAVCTRPAKPGQNINGASTILVWKTNESTQASAMLKKSPDNIYEVFDRAWGIGGNSLQVIVANGDTGNQKAISVAMLGGTTENLGENAAKSVLTIQYIGTGSASAMTIGGLTQIGKTLTTTCTGASGDNLNIMLKNYTMKSLVDYLNSTGKYTATLNTVSFSPMKAYQLDPVTAEDIKTAPVIQRRLQYEILDLLNTSARISAKIQDPTVVGLIDDATTSLTGGAQGASSNSDFSDGFAASLSEDYNTLNVAVSRDASEDIADVNQGFTDSASNYDVESVIVAADTHIALRSDTKNRKEAQGFYGVRKAAKADAFDFISAVGSALAQITMQDALILDPTGSLRYMHPHVLAAAAAGMRNGQDIGEPLTHKFPNVLAVGHFWDPTSGDSGNFTGDFNPGLDYDAAIDAGVLFLEKASGSWRWVVDNTTYGIDDSFVFNRGSVIAASQYVDRTLRATVEQIFIGHKLPPGDPKNPGAGAAKSIKNAVKAKLIELNSPQNNIISSSSDAPQGFVDDQTFVVTVTGNTAVVQVQYKPVQGLDFVFFDFTLGDVTQSA